MLMTGAQRRSVGRRRPQPLDIGLPLLPVRDIVVFPYMVVPLPVGRDASVRAVESAFNADRQLVLVTQRQGAVEEPEPDDLYQVGTVASILRMLKLPDGRLRLLVQGRSEEHTSELQSRSDLVCRLLLEKKKHTCELC